MFAKTLAQIRQPEADFSKIHLVDRNLQRYIQAQVRQLKRDFPAEGIFPGSSYAQDCCCSSAGTSHWRLAKNIKSNKTGWQDELAQNLISYVLSHMSASIVSNVHNALTVNQPLNWRDFPPCNVRQNRNNPSFVLEAASKAMQARLMLHKDAIHQCTILGAFLNIFKNHWTGCEWFRKGHAGAFPEHEYMRHELFEEALSTYMKQPSQEKFQLSADTLRWSLASLPCPLASEHPALHEIQRGPAAKHLENDVISEASGTVK